MLACVPSPSPATSPKYHVPQTAHRPLPALIAIILLVGVLALLMMMVNRNHTVQPSTGANAEVAEVN